jgi:Zn-dependent membrane protease YugP
VLVPAVSSSSPLAYVCLLFGFLFNLAGLVTLGIFVYAAMVLFTLVTLPVELNASRRGLRSLDQSGLMQVDTDKMNSIPSHLR